MDIASKDYIINTVFRTNILPIISECNTSCVFCSHKQNLGEVEVFRMPKLSISDFDEISNFLSPDNKIIIGESATRIVEGEPLLHKDFLDIVSMIRNKYKRTVIQVTTNGILLNETVINKLVELGNIELNISINCVDTKMRNYILGLKQEDSIIDKIKLINKRLKFSGSCVVVPEILDIVYIEEIIALLDGNGADNVRLFLAGYTKKAKIEVDTENMYIDILKIVKNLREKYSIPVIIEPTHIKNLDCIIDGIISGSPAQKADIRPNDVIFEVNGTTVKSRVDGFNKILKSNNPTLKIKRGEDELIKELVKKKNKSPGFIVLYDVDPEIILDINNIINNYSAKSVLFITSELAFDTLRLILDKSCLSFNYEIISCKNMFFGGNIKCAGLLTVKDIIITAKEYLSSNEKPDLIMLPPIMFDFKGRDLLGERMNVIEDELKIPIDTI